MGAPKQIGLVVHPRREIDGALDTIVRWCERHGVALGQVPIDGQARRVADPVEVAGCGLVLALGGDGTTLAALHAAAAASRPVLGIACGSIGALTSVPADHLGWALDQVAAGDWDTQQLPGLAIALEGKDGAAGDGATTPGGKPGAAGAAAGAVERSGSAAAIALNDLALIRKGSGQLIASIAVGDDLYARTAGDGLVVATPLGSTAYTMAAGGPILGPGMAGMVVTPLASHGTVAPPLVVAPEHTLRLEIEPGFSGSRIEIDGQPVETVAHRLAVTLRPDYATLVVLADQEAPFAGLRRRGLLIDAARVRARDARDHPHG